MRVTSRAGLLACLLACCSGGQGRDGEPDASADGPADGLVDVPGDCEAVAEECNYLDDDCDGVVDDGFDLETDPANCGACGVSCDAEHTTASCVDSVCVVEECEDGWHDADGDPFNGCEYECEATAGVESPDDGTCTDGLDNDCDGRTDAADPDCSDCVDEICNGLDDDCDDLVDEDFDLLADPLNCGACGTVCSHRPHATPTCDEGTCSFACDEGWHDADGLAGNGCEEPGDPCTPVPGGTETACNGVDEDCDTLIDEDYAPTTCGAGACAATSTCVAGMEDCTPGTPASSDPTCDGVDDDCDGTDDEDYVPTTCGVGACERTSTCTGGSVDCTPGTPASSDPTCDDVDDDCDGTDDEDYVPTTCGVGACERASTCTGGSVHCTPGTPGVDDDCDGVDDDCDGPADEHWVATTCGVGPCRRTATCTSGTFDCTPGTPGVDNDCDGVDDDCDGPADEHWTPWTCGATGRCLADATCSSGTESCTPRGDDSLWSSTWAGYETAVVAEMNAERAAGAFCNGTWYPPVAALTMESALQQAARCHSLDMAENDFFSHTGSDGTAFWTRCSRAGYTGFAAGENIAAGQSSAAAAVSSWMSSTSGHCEMIMNSSVTEVGIGYAYNSSAYWRRYWTADFGR